MYIKRKDCLFPREVKSFSLENRQKRVPSGKECWGRQPCQLGVNHGLVTFLLKTDEGRKKEQLPGEGLALKCSPQVGKGGGEERKGISLPCGLTPTS